MERVERGWGLGASSEFDDRLGVPDSRRLDRVRRAIDGVGLRMHGQPIVRLEDCSVIGCEALARFDGEPESTPVTWFNSAESFGLREDLELAAIQQSLEALDVMVGDNYMAINVSPQVASTARLRELLGRFPMERVVLEITEHDPIDSYPGLNRALLGMRVDGLRLAIDDAGAGYASFRHILHLQPDIIKLDGTWVADIEADVARRALISALVGYAREMDAVVIGEWVETREQAVILRDLGVQFGQGYLFGRPSMLRPAA
jgi:EAL domain-containing protein (putative c-di-GMP-specific phosphodiesterase class I)